MSVEFMGFGRLRNLALALLVACLPALAGAAKANPDDAILGAFDAYESGDPIKLARYAKQVEGHLLTPWLDYWRLSLRLEDAPVAEVREFLSRNADAYVAERLRGEWLLVLGQRRDWTEFEREAAAYGEDDLEVRCYGWLKRIDQGDDAAYSDAAGMWLEPKELPEGCEKLAATMVARGRLSVTDLWRRVRVLFEAGQITAAKTTLGYLPKNESPDERALAEAARRPKRLLERLPANLERRPAREVAILAAVRYAREDAQATADLLSGKLGARLPEKEQAYLWGRVALAGAREHHPDALAWYARAGGTPLDDDQLAWKVRAALRAGEWPTVRDAIERMSIDERHIPTWTYWYGRALVAQGDEVAGRAYFLRIAQQPEFYGLLAAEELGGAASTLPRETYVPTEAEIDAARREPGLARALEMIRLGLRTEGVKEWQYAIRYYDDPRLLAAAELARRAEVYDRAIHTAERTVRQHNFALRYPIPFRDVFGEFARNQGLDEAWVLGLVRQESRFLSDARSAAGAAGLMQIMPRTARYMASRMGMRNYQSKRVTEVQTNVTLGTRYLKLVLDQLGHPVLASAAYNAGPGRARRWRDASKALEGAIYAETIPFGETRRYVKKVMANSVFYGALLETEEKSLKARLGTIEPRGVASPLDDELP
jgi:soluble lytic murein transglycosylase